MVNAIQLTTDEFIEDHPCTHPDYIFTDLNTLRFMVDQLCLLLENPNHYWLLNQPIIHHLPGPMNWLHRFVIPRPERLRSAGQLTIVGFFGQRRNGVDPALAHEFDEVLVSEIPDYPDLLSYYSLALASGDFSNLVIFADPEAKIQWSRSRAHTQAVEQFAPDYYLSVRLYNGRLPHGLQQSHTLQLSRIKYFDYQGDSLWSAIRDME
jgi:hypothetical protein